MPPYGVAFANLLVLPVGNKLKSIVQRQTAYREMLLEGVLSIAEGEPALHRDEAARLHGLSAMARRRAPEEHENHERWLVSYADFITLLFAFFVVMYSISSINEGKYKILSDSLVGVFNQVDRSVKFPIGEERPRTTEPDVSQVEDLTGPGLGSRRSIRWSASHRACVRHSAS